MEDFLILGDLNPTMKTQLDKKMHNHMDVGLV